MRRKILHFIIDTRLDCIERGETLDRLDCINCPIWAFCGLCHDLMGSEDLQWAVKLKIGLDNLKCGENNCNTCEERFICWTEGNAKE